MKKYDFILFEHSGARNHYRDLEEIARLMQYSGMKVAIADVYYEKEYCKDPAIDHYSLKKSFYKRTLSSSDCRLTPLRFVINRIILMRYHKFLSSAMKELSQITTNIYVGSFFNDNLYKWINGVNNDVTIYVWGLRSFWLYEYRIKPFSLPGIFSFFNRNLLRNHPYVKLFVSDETIRNEYIALGISSDRLIIRPERTLTKLTKSSFSGDGLLRLLTIGSLRADKRIELIAKALTKIDCKDVFYVIAGASEKNYEKTIIDATKELKSVERINSRLCDSEYQRIIDNCDFLILCDKKQPSCITNGTMNEALLSGKPIIAPNYNPYKYIIDKYNVGISFDPDSINSLVAAILFAKERGASSFSKAIENYQKKLLVEYVSRDLASQLGYENKEI